jgi:hypothetical protein
MDMLHAYQSGRLRKTTYYFLGGPIEMDMQGSHLGQVDIKMGLQET